MEREKKRITKYLSDGDYCILVPVYYEHESKPAWRKCFVGSKQECEVANENYPDYFIATNEENREMRKNRLQEYLFLKETGRRKKEAEEIRTAYGF